MAVTQPSELERNDPAIGKRGAEFGPGAWRVKHFRLAGMRDSCQRVQTMTRRAGTLMSERI